MQLRTFLAPLAGGLLLGLAACQSKTPQPAGAEGSSPATTAEGASAPALIGDVRTVTLGAQAPDFLLRDSNGETHSLSDYRGRPVVLEWINHGCPYVVKHYGSGNMQELQARYTGEDVVWLSICSSAPAKQGHLSPDGWNQAITQHQSKASAVLIDETGVVGQAYKARTTPHMFVIDAEGRVVYDGAIDDNSSSDPATIDGAKNHVADTLDQLLAGHEVEPKSTKPYGCGVKYAN
jgi:hypothetical protein